MTTLDHRVDFELDVALPRAEALAFVRDVSRSLARVTFLDGLSVEPGAPVVVRAAIPVNAAFMGQRALPFESELHPTEAGARLVGRPIEPDGPGWAEVHGEAWVAPRGPAGAATAHVRYRFDVRVHLRLPEPERWGGRALLHMIEFTARSVLERVTAQFPAAVQAAATEAEAAVAA